MPVCPEDTRRICSETPRVQAGRALRQGADIEACRLPPPQLQPPELPGSQPASRPPGTLGRPSSAPSRVGC